MKPHSLHNFHALSGTLQTSACLLALRHARRRVELVPAAGALQVRGRHAHAPPAHLARRLLQAPPCRMPSHTRLGGPSGLTDGPFRAWLECRAWCRVTTQ